MGEWQLRCNGIYGIYIPESADRKSQRIAFVDARSRRLQPTFVVSCSFIAGKRRAALHRREIESPPSHPRG